jgi:serine/threonine protein phosphatase PrpC
VSVRSICLRGRDYPALGPLALARLPDGGALALSRGALPKAYRHVDPNEDAALLVRTRTGTLVAVADGFNGTRAAEIALDAVNEEAPDLIMDQGDRFAERIERLIAEISHRLGRAGRSRTCLSLIVAYRGACSWASFGDSMLFRSSRIEPICSENELVLGPRMRALGRATERCTGSFVLAENERVAAMSDGVSNFIADPTTIHRMLAEAPDDVQAARTLCQVAMRGGAGDNLAVATVVPTA